MRRRLFDHLDLFLKRDLEILGGVAGLTATLDAYAKSNPETVFSQSANVDELIKALQAAADKSGGVAGAGPIFDAIADFIRAIADLLRDEKPFFLELLKLLLCGCDGKGW